MSMSPYKRRHKHGFLNQISVAMLKVLILSGNTSDLAGQAALAGSLTGTHQQLTAQNLSWQVYKQVPEMC